MPAERVGFRPKTPEQLKEQTESISDRIGHPIVPVYLGNQAYAVEAQEMEQRFPIHYQTHIEALRVARREEHDIFISPESEIAESERQKEAQRKQRVATWQMLAPLATNLTRHVEAHQQREVPGVTFKPRQMTMFEKMRDRVEDGDMEGTIKAPTGWGKTVMFNQLAAAADVPTMIIVPSQDLVNQTYERFQKFTPEISVGRVYADKKEYGRQVTITTYQSLLLGDEARLINTDGIGLVIFDEVHKAISERRVKRVEALEQFRNAVFVGLSATPIEITDPRFINTRVAQMTKKIWDEVPDREAVWEGYLSSFHSTFARVSTDLSNVRITADGEYNEEDLDKALNTEIQNKAAVKFFLAKREEDRIEREQLGKKQLPFVTAWFSASVSQAQEHARLLNDEGIRAGAVWGTTKRAEKEAHKIIMEQWERGEIEVVCSNMKLVEGLDHKNVRVIFNVAPTPRGWIEKQRTGRGMRLDEENNPDKDTLVIDFVYLNSHNRRQQVTYPQVIGASRLTRRDIGTQQSYPKGSKVDRPVIHVEGIEVVTDEEEIMRISNVLREQQEQNIPLTPIDPETEAGITVDFLSDTFVRGNNKTKSISDEVLEQIAKEHPDAWREARSLGKDGKVNNTRLIALKNEYLPLYFRMMEERKVELQAKTASLIDPKTETGITVPFVNNTFVGGIRKNSPISNEVLEQIATKHPGALREARSLTRKGKRGQKLTALKNEYLPLYFRMMEERKVELQDVTKVINLKHEVGITVDFLRGTFVGTGSEKKSISDQVLDQLAKEYPGAWRKARGIKEDGKISSNNVTALKNEYVSLYIQMMQERGVELR